METNQEVLIGNGSYTVRNKTKNSGMFSITTRNFNKFVSMILPKRKVIVANNFNENEAIKFWERRGGEHKGGHFYSDHYKKYLYFIYG